MRIRLIAITAVFFSFLTNPPSALAEQARSFAIGPFVQPVHINASPAQMFLPLSGQYAGRTQTLPGFYATLDLAYDADDNSFFYTQQGTVEQALWRVTPSGNNFEISNDVPFFANALAYDPMTKLLYATIGFSFNVSDSIYSISPQTGIVTFVAGGTNGTADGQGSAAQFQNPQGLAVDPTTGNLIVADVDRLREVTPSGLVSTITPPSSFGPEGSGGFVSGQEGVAFDAAKGAVYVADPNQNIVLKMERGGAIRRIAGRCITLNSFSGCDRLERDGPEASALFGNPCGIVVDPIDGAVYISDAANNQIRKLKSGFVTTLSGNGHAGDTDGIGQLVTFTTPIVLSALPKNGLLYVVQMEQFIRTVTTQGSTPPPPRHGVMLLDPPSVESGPAGIAATADGSVWFSESNDKRIGQITSTDSFREFRLPLGFEHPTRIVVGSDGALWFSNDLRMRFNGVAAIGRMTTLGAFTEYLVPGGGEIPPDLTLGPDSNVWFLGGSGGLSFITPAGVFATFAGPQGVRISTGYDGDLWLSTLSSAIDRFSVAGKLLSQLGFTGYNPGDIEPGLNGDMWFTQNDAVGYFNHQTAVEFPLPSCNCFETHGVSNIVTGADEAMWFTETGVGYVGRMTARGSYSQYLIPAARSAPSALTRAADGSIWFVDPGSHKIGKVY